MHIDFYSVVLFFRTSLYLFKIPYFPKISLNNRSRTIISSFRYYPNSFSQTLIQRSPFSRFYSIRLPHLSDSSIFHHTVLSNVYFFIVQISFLLSSSLGQHFYDLSFFPVILHLLNSFIICHSNLIVFSG